MKINRNDLAAAVIAECLAKARVGVVIRDLNEIDPAVVAESVSQKVKRPLHVATIDHQTSSKSTQLTVSANIEDAVSWRNRPALAGKILVFVNGEKKRLHSLQDLDTITPRDIAHEMLANARNELSINQPQTKFWSALQDEASTFPLSKLESFVKAVATGKTNVDSIPESLWLLGLLHDAAILQPNYDPKDRLRRNRELVVEMGQLSEASRKRMNSVLARAEGGRNKSLLAAFKQLMEFFRRGGEEILKALDVGTVELLLKTGRPTAGVQPLPADTPDVDKGEGFSETGSAILDKPLRGRRLVENIATLVVRNDSESAAGLHEFGEHYRENVENSRQLVDVTISDGFGGTTLQPDKPAVEFLTFMGCACSAASWGGVLRTDYTNIKDGIRHANLDGDFQNYDPEDLSKGILGHSLFSLLRKLDDFLEADKPLTVALQQLTRSRAILSSYLDLQLAYPLVLFGGYPEATRALSDYLGAYARLIHTLRVNDATLHTGDPGALRYVTNEVLRLDVIFVKTPSEWKAILTPLHPFHLWRYREIFRTIHGDSGTLSAEEQMQLSRALPDLPHLLHFVTYSTDSIAERRIDLPQAGSYELLPTYENHTNRYLGNDGIEFLGKLIRRWLEFAPYSRGQIRLALVDVPDLRSSLKAVADYLSETSDTRVVVHFHFTRGQKPSGELIRFDYDDKDHELAMLLEGGRLSFQINSHKSLTSVLEVMQGQPVHIAYLFDQSLYQLGYAPHARHLLVSPLVVTHQYEYSETFQRGNIAPSSETEEGLFADFHFLVNRAAHLPPGKQLQLQHEGELDLRSINAMLQQGLTRWLVIADRVLTPYRLTSAIPLSEQRAGNREIGIWTNSTPQSVAPFVDLLRQFNLRPDSAVISGLLQRFSHIAAGGMFSIPLSGRSGRETKTKGLLGTVLAAAWYARKYPGSLIASLDSNLAQQWLKSRPNSSERADLIGMRMDGGTLVIEPIEVKTHAEGAEVKVAIERGTGRRRLEGRAVGQLTAMLEALEPIFGGKDFQPLFTPARREVLKYQLYRECFREIYDPEWQKSWFATLQRAFALPTPLLGVKLRGVILHIHLESNTDFRIVDDAMQPITLVEIGSKGVQSLVAVETISEGHIVDLEDEAVKSSSVEIAPPKIKKSRNPKSSELKDAEDFPVPDGPPLPTQESESELDELAFEFRRACQSYRIEIDECDAARAVVGPTVQRFYVRLRRGQRIDPLRNALEDIGREMRRSGLLVTSIANSDEVAVDIPRNNRETISLFRGLAKLPVVTTPEVMPIPIGVTPEGVDIIRDLSEMPHLLVGGTTGSGKTVFLYGLLSALLQTHADPSSLSMLLSTSGPEDFSFFEGLPHLEENRIISNAQEAIDLLQTRVTNIFEERQVQLSDARCRDIGDFNRKYPNSPLAPYVVVVDEFADLADQLAGNRAKKDSFYTVIRRVAQLGRKRGVHLVLCTQRPSADLVPTNIRNLMNGRVSLHVNDATASRMILDEAGAEQLQMRGDLLFKEQSSLLRAQGYYVTGDELDVLLESYRQSAEKKPRKRKARR